MKKITKPNIIKVFKASGKTYFTKPVENDTMNVGKKQSSTRDFSSESLQVRRPRRSTFTVISEENITILYAVIFFQ